MSTDADTACPDPHCKTRLRVERVGLRTFSHADVTVVPLAPKRDDVSIWIWWVSLFKLQFPWRFLNKFDIDFISYWERPRGIPNTYASPKLSERLTIIYIEIDGGGGWSIWLIYTIGNESNDEFFGNYSFAFCWDTQMRRPFQCLYQSTYISEGVSIHVHKVEMEILYHFELFGMACDPWPLRRNFTSADACVIRDIAKYFGELKFRPGMLRLNNTWISAPSGGSVTRDRRTIRNGTVCGG